MTYTGNEPIYPLVTCGGSIIDGETLYSKTLREFMCEVYKQTRIVNFQTVAEIAHDLTKAYLDQLNKNQQP